MQIDVRSPFPFEAVPRIWRWIEPFRYKVMDDYGPRTLEDFMAYAAAKWQQQTTWAIYADGELGGLITFERLTQPLGTAHWIFKPDFQGRGIALKASRIAVSQMFETGISKLAFYPFRGNVAMGSLLCSLGAKREGTLLAQTQCNGKPTDMWVYGLSKSQFQEKQHALSSNPNTVTHRSGIVDSRLGPVGQVADLDQHAHALTGDAGAAKAVDGLQQQSDD